jgi:hypothetical protein
MIFLQLKYRFISSKIYEVVFQQLTIYALVLALSDYFEINYSLALWGSLVFGILHLPILLAGKDHGKLKYVFFFISFIIGGLFIFLINANLYYLLITYTLHMQLYILGGLLFWFVPYDKISKLQ